MEDEINNIEEARNALNYEVTPKQLQQTLEHVLSSVDPDGSPKEQAAVFVWGAMGIGKSDICRSVAKKWGMRVVALHLPQFDPTDVKGIPLKMDDGTVRWVPSSYLPQFEKVSVPTSKKTTTVDFSWPSAESVMVHILDSDENTIFRYNDWMNGDVQVKGKSTKNQFAVEVDMDKGTAKISGDLKKGYTILVIDKAFLFLDELSAAVPEVQNAALQLVLDRRIGEYDLPPYTPIAAAGNRESDEGFVNQMSMPLNNRFLHLRLVPALGEWMEWAIKNKIHTHILGYLDYKKLPALFNFSPGVAQEGDCGFATPRSWHKLSNQMRGMESLPEPIKNAIITGYIGTALGSDFIEYRKVCELLPDPNVILAGGDATVSDELNIGAKYSLATSLCYAIKELHDTHYDSSIGGDVSNQSEEWQIATKSFCNFIDEYLGAEMTVLCIHIVSKYLDISFSTFRGTEFSKFAKKYHNILRKTI